MFDKYMIVGEHFKNIEEDGEITGYQFGMRLPYYRGVVLSLIGELILEVDEEVVSIDNISITIGGKLFPYKEMVDEPVHKWEFGEVGLIKVAKPGGLKPGHHKISLRQHMKISYVIGGFWGQDCKRLILDE